ncbi:dolichyl-diphosphooligosaccharide--protein glycosyltransferase 48 kDa subunit-like [Rutidosis leptorrhynchoides]|uniref:dolichyl-diphosphooligosaccharide--protein glycosyltransferase 48 kDa subunit-like n=1 Tax=Rutidosis leptorrhynchoides TaxID=125765 RepID=UPI003A99ACD0
MANSRDLWILFTTITLFYLSITTLAFESDPQTKEHRKVLVLLDDLYLRSSHSTFFNSLKTRGYDLEFKLAADSSLSLHRYGHYLYDGLILFSPSTQQFGGSLDSKAVLDFVDSGHDLILAADASASDLIRGIAKEFGVDFDEDDSAVVIDHGSYAVSEKEGDHTLIVGEDFIQSDVILGKNGIQAPVLFRGIAHSLNAANSLVVKALSASPSAYSANPSSKLSHPPSLTGSGISLVSIMQARNNARVMITGSLEMFSNRLFRSGVQRAGNHNKYEKSGNEQFVAELSKWIFHERGHLKAINLRHHKSGESEKPTMYRIKDDLEFYVEIYEWSGKSWEPYVADDVQVQFYLMTPYVLKTLSSDQKGLYRASFKVPDVYGVFQFKVEYHKLGYTSLSLSEQSPVRPYNHNEYERFITTAFPYYGASFVTMAGFFVFSFVFLYQK